MESKKNQIIITNKKITDFYSKNKHIDIEKVNLLYIDLLTHITDSDISNNTVANDIIRTLTEQNKDIHNIISIMNMNTEIYKNTNNNIKSDMENIKLLLSNMTSSFLTKIYETKDIYINEFRNLLKSNDNQQLISITSSIEKYNQTLSDKLLLLLNDIIPKSHSSYFENIISIFRNDINSIFDKKNTALTIDNVSLIVENKSNTLIQNINEQIIKYISNSENNLTANINNIKEITNTNHSIQDKINQELLLYLNKNKNSASKGIIGEEKLHVVLNELFPTADIINTTGKTASGDFILKRTNKPTILIENKLYSTNVDKHEIDKFIRDINKNKCHGIFISEQSGIVGKDNFQIDIHDNFILVYIHKCNYESYKINTAINIIDIVSSKINHIHDKNATIPNDILTNINNEFQAFIISKEKLITTFKDFHKKTIEQLNDINLPSLDFFLSSYYANNKKNNILCDICKKYNTDNLKSLARHKHSCKNKKEIASNSTDEDIKTP